MSKIMLKDNMLRMKVIHTIFFYFTLAQIYHYVSREIQRLLFFEYISIFMIHGIKKF